MPLPADRALGGQPLDRALRRGPTARCGSPIPASARRTIARAEFEQKWSGYAALFDYTRARSTAAPEGAARRSPGCWLPAPVHGVLIAKVARCSPSSPASLQMLLPVFTQVIVDRVVVEQDVGLLNMVVARHARRARLHDSSPTCCSATC